MRVLKRWESLLLFLSCLWMMYTIFSGLIAQISSFVSSKYFHYYFLTVWYVYIGSWISYICLSISLYGGLKACIHYQSWIHFVAYGLIGMVGYLVPIITYTIHSGSLYVSFYFILPLYMVGIGLKNRKHRNTSSVYIPLFLPFNQK